MTRCIFSMKDELNGFVNIFLESSEAVAKRNFLHSMATADINHLFYSHPEDYSLWYFGEFGLDGTIVLLDTPRLVVRGEKR